MPISTNCLRRADHVRLRASGSNARGAFYSEPTQGDQPRFERGREGMEPEACESATGRGTEVLPLSPRSPATSTAPPVGTAGRKDLWAAAGTTLHHAAQSTSPRSIASSSLRSSACTAR